MLISSIYGNIYGRKKKRKSKKLKKKTKIRIRQRRPSWEPAQELRAMPYVEFLKSNYWLDARVIFYRAAGFKCQKCGAKNVELNVHHKTYDHLGDEWDYTDDVIILCRECHKREHTN